MEFRIDRRARRISVTVCPARRRLVLTAPSERARRKAYEFLSERKAWAEAQLARLPAAMPFRAGGEIPLRGTMLRLTPAPGRGAPFVERARGAPFVESARGAPLVENARGGPLLEHAPGVPCDDRDRLMVPGREEILAGRVRRFLRGEAQRDLTQALARHCAALGVPVPDVRLRDTRSRWGSCTADGAVSFSWRLVCAPDFVLDHVAAHEAAHLVHLNHGKRFRALEQRLSPRSDEAGIWLAANGPLLHAVGAES